MWEVRGSPVHTPVSRPFLGRGAEEEVHFCIVYVLGPDLRPANVRFAHLYVGEGRAVDPFARLRTVTTPKRQGANDFVTDGWGLSWDQVSDRASASL